MAAPPTINASAFSVVPQNLLPVALELKFFVDKLIPCLILINPSIADLGVKSYSLIIATRSSLTNSVKHGLILSPIVSEINSTSAPFNH